MVHWIWIPVSLFVGCCLGFLALALCNAASGDYYPSLEDAEQVYRPRQNVHRFKPGSER